MRVVRSTDAVARLQEIGVVHRRAQLVEIDRALAPLEEWHEVGAPEEPRFTNGWYGRARFRKDNDGFVYLDGQVGRRSASRDPIFTLPEGYRPPYVEYARPLMDPYRPTMASEIVIHPDGRVRITSNEVWELRQGWPWLNSIVFRAS